ncbi:DUF4011 domain-containing protein [Phytoactinopolyspora halotolerans]|uniref:DUF4011 domain-containing protein n=1 Tax=Phytoactinopolyspora halotolerans TaxID=1981512 RepID=A0A6L9S972_9ACTN|nr:DUF4011 domain-containing protein [Phytoactinopolyspora halotolerans]NEE01142.1 DUF4011 domain-containing protein [Phytoactinopolyspora halotolerans]
MRHSDGLGEVVEQWRDELAALGGRDPLLSFRDLKVGTLDLAAAEPEARQRLIDGEPVVLSKLFPHEPLRSSALRSTRAIRDKSRELFEERGINVGLLAVGIATWSNPFVAHRPTAPVLLRTASVVAQDPAETDFVITVDDDPVVNPVLLHALDTQVGLRFKADDLRDHSGQLKYPTVVERLREFAPAHVVDGFSIAHRAVLATFAMEPLLLSRDIEQLGADLASHDIVAALAGDAHASRTIGSAGEQVTPEYVAFDLDSHQHDVVAAAAGGGNLLVDAPPGSGRTQTVASIVAELVGRGQRVLVVSHKRATAADLITRLDSAGLSDVVLDIGTSSSTEAVAQVVDTAHRLREAGVSGGVQPENPQDVRAAEHLRSELDAYRDAMHRRREPDGTSAYDAMVAVASADESIRTDVRISPSALDGARTAEQLRSHLREYTDLEGLTLTEKASPWFGSRVHTAAVADSLATTVVGLRDSYVPELRDAATRAAVEVGLGAPNTIEESVEVVELLSSVESTLSIFGSRLWDEPIDDLVAATAPRRSHPNDGGDGPGFFARRRLRRRAAELAGGSGRGQRDVVHKRLAAAREQLAAWRERSRDGKPPRTGQFLARAVDAVKALHRRLDVLTEANPRTRDLSTLPFSDVAKRLEALARDEAHLRALPRLTELESELVDAGLEPLLDDLRNRSVPPDRVEQVLDYAWLASLLDHWRNTDSALRGFDPADHRRKAEEFRAVDAAVVRAGANRVLRSRAAHFAEVADEYAGQSEVLEGTVGQGSGDIPRTPRQLLEMAPEVALAAAPCWVMSPLNVATVLPPRRLFDVVIIEDAGRVAVAQAVPAIARGSRVVVVADDEVALTSFTTAVEPAPDPDEHEGPWAGEPPASVADLLRDVLPVYGLRGQYRFRDDRLVGFAARVSYAGRLTTVPSAGGNPRVTLELVEARAGGDDPVDSSSAEVSRVVELVLEHLRARPHESLGVVTLGPRHAERLDAALRRALVRAPDVARLLREERTEPFFVKDVERVAGDVRDAIILSLGYGRSVDGRILYRFGALGRPGGERRLASATTRGRERLTVVSTFGADDLSPRRLTTPGSQALGEFLAYLESGQQAVDQEQAPGQDALAEAIAERLRQAGAAVAVGYGGPGGFPVAVRHPVRSDRMVLAVETDSPDGPAARSARERERLRPNQLARLGWSLHRVCAEAWVSDPDGEAKRLVHAYEEAVSVADAYDWAVAAAEADVVAGMPDEPTPSADPSFASDAGAVSAETDSPDASDAEIGDSAAADEAGDAMPDAEEEPPVPARTASRPEITPGWPVSDYTVRELSAVSRWVESDGVARSEDETIDLVALELGLSMDDARNRDVLRHAVRVARAGASS